MNFNVEFELDGSPTDDQWMAGDDLEDNLEGDWTLVVEDNTQYLALKEE